MQVTAEGARAQLFPGERQPGRYLPLADAPPWLAEHMVSAKAEAAHRVLG
jgi:hypothetical protein